MKLWTKTILCLVSASLLSLQAFAAGEGERAESGIDENQQNVLTPRAAVH